MEKELHCSFCRSGQDEVNHLIAGPSVYICDECIHLCQDILVGEEQKGWIASGVNPDQIKTSKSQNIKRFKIQKLNSLRGDKKKSFPKNSIPVNAWLALGQYNRKTLRQNPTSTFMNEKTYERS